MTQDFEQLEVSGELFESASGMDNSYALPPTANNSLLSEFAYVSCKANAKLVSAIAMDSTAHSSAPNTQFQNDSF